MVERHSCLNCLILMDLYINSQSCSLFTFRQNPLVLVHDQQPLEVPTLPHSGVSVPTSSPPSSANVTQTSDLRGGSNLTFNEPFLVNYQTGGHCASGMKLEVNTLATVPPPTSAPAKSPASSPSPKSSAPTPKIAPKISPVSSPKNAPKISPATSPGASSPSPITVEAPTVPPNDDSVPTSSPPAPSQPSSADKISVVASSTVGFGVVVMMLFFTQSCSLFTFRQNPLVLVHDQQPLEVPTLPHSGVSVPTSSPPSSASKIRFIASYTVDLALSL
ncbi:uncharacterized protein LOC132031993 [Lycium ferocissimum]|uniref:uncharacterized protein LOC132031993 n=1 Tax=Lycium ferocissimum TaxID=112874 RepID=UPI0028158245|nr:uncharacterized protein LOC132031993 [Lycium ferocissimum]